jgi:hypothetical protein
MDNPALEKLATDLLTNIRDQMLRPMHDSVVREGNACAQQMQDNVAAQLSAIENHLAQAVGEAANESAKKVLSALDSIAREGNARAQQMKDTLATQLAATEDHLAQVVDEAANESAKKMLSALCGALQRLSWNEEPEASKDQENIHE